MDFEQYKQYLSERIYRTRQEPEFWRVVRSPENVEDTVAALNEIRMEQAEVCKGKRAASNPSWPHTALFVKEVECRLTGVRNRQHDRQVSELKNRIRTLEAQVASYEQAA